MLSGSSARKLRRGGVNLLAGRAFVRHLFPLVVAEMSNQFDVNAAQRWVKRYNRGLNRMRQELGENQVACYGVHPGRRPANWDGIQVMPTTDFMKRMWDGEILPA